MGLSPRQRSLTRPDGKTPSWTDRVCQAAYWLEKRGEMDHKAEPGVWRLTEKGRRRAEKGDD
jgi:hypothetical protein